MSPPSESQPPSDPYGESTPKPSNIFPNGVVLMQKMGYVVREGLGRGEKAFEN